MKRFVTRYGTRALVAVLAMVPAGPIGCAGRSLVRCSRRILYMNRFQIQPEERAHPITKQDFFNNFELRTYADSKGVATLA